MMKKRTRPTAAAAMAMMTPTERPVRSEADSAASSIESTICRLVTRLGKVEVGLAGVMLRERGSGGRGVAEEGVVGRRRGRRERRRRRRRERRRR